MAGSLTVGGMSDGLLVGQVTVGPNTMSGKRQIGDLVEITLEANVDYVVKVPSEAVAFVVVFTFTGTAPGEVKLRTNLNNADTGLPILSQGWFALPLYTGVTELKFKAASPPQPFQLSFI